MGSAFRVFGRGFSDFVDVMIVVALLFLLVAIALILLPCAALLERTALRPHRVRHIGNRLARRPALRYSRLVA